MKEQKIYKTVSIGDGTSHCYDGTGWFRCSFWVSDETTKESKCMLFGVEGVKKHLSESLKICDKIYGKSYKGEV